MYTNYYGFSAKPFQLSPDPRFFFGSSVHKRALAYLRYGLSQAEGFIVITGGIGTGKTTLVRNLFNELDTKSVVAAQLVTTQLEAEDLLRMVVAAFGLPHEGLNKAALIKRFEDFLTACARNGKRILLIVDEAQNLPSHSLEELRMLSNYQIADAPLLQSFLLGQEEFRTTLQAPEMEQLRQRVIASCHLNPLNSQETCEYIEHRLHVVGWRAKPYFTDECYALIHRFTQGIPRRINVLCDRLLLYGFLEELQEFDGQAVMAVSKEFNQEIVNPTSQSNVSKRNAATKNSTANNNDIDRRLNEIERFIAALALEKDPQSKIMKSMEKRLDELSAQIEEIQKTTNHITN
jgi:putative secretion ATPase (PEP-CTERM system associated)